MIGSLSRIPAAHPIKFGVGISAIKTSAADFVAQRVVEGRDTLELQNMREDCIVCWTTWIPAFLVNFSVMPMWGRVPFVAAVSFGFTTYFSFLRGGPSDDAG